MAGSRLRCGAPDDDLGKANTMPTPRRNERLERQDEKQVNERLRLRRRRDPPALCAADGRLHLVVLDRSNTAGGSSARRSGSVRGG